MSNYRVWLVERRALHLVLATAVLGLVIGVFSDTFVPLPISFARASAPLVAYLPAIAALIAAIQLSRHLEPYESLSPRPIWFLECLLLCVLTLVFGTIMFVSYVVTGHPLSLLGARNFAFGLWAGVLAVTVLGIRRGSAIAVTTLILLVPLTPRGFRGTPNWWALSEAPYNSALAAGAVVMVFVAGVISLRFRMNFVMIAG